MDAPTQNAHPSSTEQDPLASGTPLPSDMIDNAPRPSVTLDAEAGEVVIQSFDKSRPEIRIPQWEVLRNMEIIGKVCPHGYYHTDRFLDCFDRQITAITAFSSITEDEYHALATEIRQYQEICYPNKSQVSPEGNPPDYVHLLTLRGQLAAKIFSSPEDWSNFFATLEGHAAFLNEYEKNPPKDDKPEDGHYLFDTPREWTEMAYLLLKLVSEGVAFWYERAYDHFLADDTANTPFDVGYEAMTWGEFSSLLRAHHQPCFDQRKNQMTGPEHEALLAQTYDWKKHGGGTYNWWLHDISSIVNCIIRIGEMEQKLTPYDLLSIHLKSRQLGYGSGKGTFDQPIRHFTGILYWSRLMTSDALLIHDAAGTSIGMTMWGVSADLFVYKRFEYCGDNYPKDNPRRIRAITGQTSYFEQVIQERKQRSVTE